VTPVDFMKKGIISNSRYHTQVSTNVRSNVKNTRMHINNKWKYSWCEYNYF